MEARMSRLVFGGTSADVVFSPTGELVPGATVTFWYPDPASPDTAGDIQADDLRTLADEAIEVVTADESGFIRFKGPDGYDGILFGDAGVGPKVACYPLLAQNAYDVYDGVSSGTSARPWFNVMDHGAFGDGTIDDTLAVQAALDAAKEVGGGVVYLPAGTYLVSATYDTEHPNTDATKACLLVDSNITLLGEGAGVSILKMSTVDSTEHTDIVYALDQSNITIACVGFNGAGARTLPVESVGVFLDSCVKTRLMNVDVTSPNTAGFYLYACDDAELTNLRADTVGVATEGGVGLFLDTCRWVTVSGVIVKTSGLHGVTLSTCSDVTASNVIAHSCGADGLTITTASTRITLSNVTATSCTGNGVDIVDSTHITLTGVTAYDNDDGLYVDDSQNVIVASLRSFDNGEVGLRLANAADTVTLTGELLTGNTTAAVVVTSGAVLNRALVVTGAPTSGDIATFDGSKWVPDDAPSGGGGVDRWVYYDDDEDEWPTRPIIAGHVIWRSVGSPDAIAPPGSLDNDDWEPDDEAELG